MLCRNSVCHYKSVDCAAIIGILTEMKQVPGVITGRQQGGSSMYIPAIYSKSQNDWVKSFYKQNGYLGMLQVCNSVFL